MASCSKKFKSSGPGDKPILKEISKEKGDQTVEKVYHKIQKLPSRKKTLCIDFLGPQTKISDIINFFKDVGQVFRVRLALKRNFDLAGFVEFASANEAKKALEKKDCEYFLGDPISLDMATITKHTQQMYCIDHKVWNEDYLERQSLVIGEGEPVADFAEAVVFVANLSPQTKIWHINEFFENVGEAVSVRLIGNHQGRHVGYGFVEFASAYEARKALEEKNGEYLHDHRIFLQVVKIASYPPQHKCNLAERLCYEDYIRRESPLIGEDELEEPPNSVEAVGVREKTIYFPHLNDHIGISDVRVGGCYVEFASAKEANKALRNKNGEILLGEEVHFQMAEAAPPENYMDYKVWYEDYLGRESLVIEEEEDEAVEPDFLEEVYGARKTIFVANFPPHIGILHIKRIFHCVSNVVSVRLIVNQENKHVGCAYVEFASAKEASKAMQEKYTNKGFHGRKLFMTVGEMAPYPPRPRYSHAEMLWYTEFVRQEELARENYDMAPKAPVFCGKKITFSYDD